MTWHGSSIAMLLLLLASQAHSQYVPEGGNVTPVDLHQENGTLLWDGIFGEVVLGPGANASHTVFGGNISRINLIAQTPPCNYSSLTMHVMAVNASTLTPSISSGNLSLLDSYIGGSPDGSDTFTFLSSYALSYGLITNTPSVYLYAGNASSTVFRQGYLNDVPQNLVFATPVVSDQPDWNGTTSDYQMMLPRMALPTDFLIWVDTNYTCINASAPPSGDDDEHDIYIHPVGVFEVAAGSSFSPGFLIDNNGDYTEWNVDVTLDCPSGFTCGSGFLDKLLSGESENVPLPISVDGPGEFVITVCADSDDASYCRDFIIRVVPECEADGDCPEDQYCSGGDSCEEKKPEDEECGRGAECQSGLCDGGICVLCESDDDCPSDSICSSGSCILVQCPCGEVSDHSCITYACCMDEDCGACSSCISNLCETVDFDILYINGDLIEGEPIRIKVVDRQGQPVFGASVSSGGSGSATTDLNGFATIPAPYDGIIYASTSCHQAGLMLDVSKLGFIVIEPEIFADEETVISIVDSRGLPVVGAVVIIDGISSTTGPQGRFPFTFNEPGSVPAIGTKPGFNIIGAEIPVLARSVRCGFPMFITTVYFDGYQPSQLWLLSIVLAMVNFIFYDNRARIDGLLRKIVYSFGPLLVALPAFGTFTICLVANIVLFQAILEMLMIIRRNTWARPPSDKGGPSEWIPGLS